jgi:hypothetical protein
VNEMQKRVFNDLTSDKCLWLAGPS